ncbi:RND family efflux transporter MFP subunit [Candidatus Magnetomorum sp. HK-1]|nr:RND family efflux transporter MFP subunit [Candidatus Magnetomorum sp. HK-1]
MIETKDTTGLYKFIIRVIICISILISGFLGMKMLANLKKPPTEAKKIEKPLRVMARKMVSQDISVKIKAYGEIKAKDMVNISPEVSGRVTFIHPRLETGEIINTSEILFQIDDKNYIAAVKELKALVAQGESSIQRVQTQYSIDKKRLKNKKRNMELSKDEFLRVKRLFQKNKVGTQSQVDVSEKNYNLATDQFYLLTQTIELYPYRIKEAQYALTANQARLEVALANLERCQVKAAFDGRVKWVQIENGQFVNKGQHVLSLANDKQLEILVPIDSRDAQEWLQFKESKNVHPSIAWFDDLLNVSCLIHWTEAPDQQSWTGKVHRVVNFNEHTRTITIAILVDSKNAVSHKKHSLPLVEGMFCQVEIPGKKLKKVYSLPRWAVTYENTVYLAKENRLKTVPVTVAKLEPEIAIISKGIEPQDIVIITRLTDPMENALLDIIFEQ